MNRIFVTLLATVFYFLSPAQPSANDTNYTSKAISLYWMPDGKSILFTVVRFHKTDNKAPFYSKAFRYELTGKSITPVFDNPSNLVPSPDGKSFIYMRRDDRKRTDIYLYNTDTKLETLFYTDSLRKNALNWSPDGKKLVYNVSYHNTTEICVLDIASKRINIVTNSGKDKSYNPSWSPDNKTIAYYLEKGDGHDQIWLTDSDGSFHKNLTNDTTTHNYFPSWIDKNTVLYTQSPGKVITMQADGSHRQKITDMDADEIKYNPHSGKLVYVTTEADNKIFLVDWKNKINEVILDEARINALKW